MAVERSGSVLSPVGSASRIGRGPSVGPRAGSFESVRLINPNSFPIRGESRTPIPDFRFEPLRPRQLKALRAVRLEPQTLPQPVPEIPRPIPVERVQLSPEVIPVSGIVPISIEYQRLANRIRAVQRLMSARRAKVFAGPEVSAFAQTKTAAQSKAESAPGTKPAIGIKITQAERTKILTGLRRVNGKVSRKAAQNRQAESAAVQKAHDVNRNRIMTLDAAFEKIEKERGAVKRDELIKESGFLGEADESPLIQQLGLNKKDGSKPRIVKAFDPIRIKRSEIAGIVLKNTAVRLGDKDATEPATHTEIRNVLTLPDIADTLTDYERVLRRVLIRELKQEAVAEDTNIQAQTADKIEGKNTEEEKIIPGKIVIFPGLSPFTEAGLLAALDNPLDNIGVIERRQLLLAA